jgi:hypothetical protein
MDDWRELSRPLFERWPHWRALAEADPAFRGMVVRKATGAEPMIAGGGAKGEAAPAPTPAEKTPGPIARATRLVNACPSRIRRHDCGCGVNQCLAWAGDKGDGLTTNAACKRCQAGYGWWGALPRIVALPPPAA